MPIPESARRWSLMPIRPSAGVHLPGYLPRHSSHLLSTLAPTSDLPLFCVLRKKQLKRAAEEPALRNHGPLGQLSELGGKLGRAEKGNLGLVGFAWH